MSNDNHANVYFIDRATGEALYSNPMKVPWIALEEGKTRTVIMNTRTFVDLIKYRIVLEHDMTPPKESKHSKLRFKNPLKLDANDIEACLPSVIQMEPQEFIGMETQKALTLLKEQHP